MLPHEARPSTVSMPGTAPAVGPLLPPESLRKGLYLRPTVERDGFAIHPNAPDREQLIRDRVTYIGTPQPIYNGLVYAFEHDLFEGIDPKEWNATITYYTTARSMENLAKSAREEFGLNLASMWPMAKVFSRTIRGVKTKLLAHGYTEANAINPDERKNMQAGIYKERQLKAVGTQEAREEKRTRMLAEPKDSKRRQRSSETLKKQRQDPEFLAKLLAAEPGRIANITTTWRRKGEEMRQARQALAAPVVIETPEQPVPIASPVESQPDTPEVLMLKQLAAVDSTQRQHLIAQTYGKMHASHEQGLLAIVTGGQDIDEFTPFMQGFLLMKLLSEEQGITVRLSSQQGENIASKLNNRDIASQLITYAQTDNPLYPEFVNLAHAQFALPREVDIKTIGERVKQRIRQNKQDFIYGIAVMYFLASHGEKQPAK